MLISIVMANLNQGKYIEESLLSVLKQNNCNFELIVVDGGSRDNSVEIIEKYSDRLAWWISEPDAGQSDAFNKGFAKAKGDYFMWLNADDLLLPGALAEASRYLKRHQDCKWLAGDTVYFNSEGKIYRCLYGPYWNSWLMKQTQVCNIVNGPSSIFHRSLYEKVGGIDVNLHYCMDADLWIKITDAGARFHRLHRYIWGFRIHEGSKTFQSTVHLSSEEIKNETSMVLLRAKRVRTQAEVWLLRIFKIITGTHFRTLYDTWHWKDQFIDSLVKELSCK